MLSRDYRDIVGGLILVVFGLWVAWYSAQNYDTGTFRRMGPGMFPLILGFVLAGFGAAVAAPAFFREGPKLEIRFWSPLFVILAVASFALIVRPFGLFPAIVSVTVISSFADLRFRPVTLVVLSATLCLIVWLIFRVGLGLPMALYRWPF